MIFAVWAAIDISNGDIVLPALICGCMVLLIAQATSGHRVETLLLGGLLVGLIIGNRGFAQLMFIPGVPMLPAEGTLILIGLIMIGRLAVARRLPINRDALNYLIIAWLVLGSVRLAFDLRIYGLLAVRDFATCYYALFFFIGQEMAREEKSLNFVRSCLLIAFLVLPVVLQLFQSFPMFFLSSLTFGGVPAIILKGDVAVPIAAAGIFFFHFDRKLKGHAWSMVAALGLLLVVFASNSRAAQAGVLLVDAWLLLKRSKLPLLHLGTLATAAVLLAALAYSGQAKWAEGRVQTTVERVLSMVDVKGAKTYESDELGDKADNNRFRVEWWRIVATETLTEHPIFGKGFGADLSSAFVRSYDPLMLADFSARSPHSIIFTVLGRVGLVGLIVVGAIVGIVMVKTHRLYAQADTGDLGYWLMGWVILISACFGVVMEGPMGAVPFWTILGIASTTAGASENKSQSADVGAHESAKT